MGDNYEAAGLDTLKPTGQNAGDKPRRSSRPARFGTAIIPTNVLESLTATR